MINDGGKHVGPKARPLSPDWAAVKGRYWHSLGVGQCGLPTGPWEGTHRHWEYLGLNLGLSMEMEMRPQLALAVASFYQGNLDKNTRTRHPKCKQRTEHKLKHLAKH